MMAISTDTKKTPSGLRQENWKYAVIAKAKADGGSVSIADVSLTLRASRKAPPGRRDNANQTRARLGVAAADGERRT